jgi:NodT family efflux transporter outer membrane factor (OMF) lipoprotein
MKRALLLITVTLGGCTALRPLPEAASVVVPVRYAYAPETAPDGVIGSLLPSDPAFAPLRTAALSAPNLEAAVARIDAARASVRAARSARLPDITASGTVSGERGSAAAQPNNPSFDRDQARFEPGIQARWDLDVFGGLRASQRAGQARLDAAGADADAVRLALDCDIALALIDFREASAREEVVRRDVADNKELVRLTRLRARAGIVPEFDVVRADALTKDAEARLSPFAGQKADAVGRIVALTALDASEVMRTLAAQATSIPPAELSAGVPSRLLRNRPDVRAAEYRLAAAKQDVANAAAQRFPKLTLTGTLGLLALAAGDLFSADALTATVGAGVSGPLLDFGRVASEIDRNDALAREAFAVYRGTVFQAIGDTEGFLGQLASARKRSKASEAQVLVDIDALGLARERYRLGLTDFLVVVDAQRTFNQTRQNAASAYWQTWRDATQLYRALGGDGGSPLGVEARSGS